MKKFVKYPKSITASTEGRPDYKNYRNTPLTFVNDTDDSDIDVKFIKDLVNLYRLRHWNVSMSRDGSFVYYTSDDDDVFGIARVDDVIDFIKRWKAEDMWYHDPIIDPLIGGILNTGEKTKGYYVSDTPRYNKEKRELKSKYRNLNK